MLNVHQNLITYAWNRVSGSGTEHFVYLSHPDLEVFMREYCMATAQAITGHSQAKQTAKFTNGSAITIRRASVMTSNQFRGVSISSLLLDSDMFNVNNDWNIKARKILAENIPAFKNTEFYLLLNDSGVIVAMSYDNLLNKLGV